MTTGFRRVAAVLLALCLAVPRAGSAEPLHVLAAGSLTGSFTEMVKSFPVGDGDIAPPVFGPSGVLRERIERGEAADLFASADMEQPRRLGEAHPAAPVIMFTRNQLCALGRATLGLTRDNLLDHLLDPAVRVATSTPGADPGGDYAWAVFARAEAVHPGAQAILEHKALKLVGGRDTPILVPGRGAVQGVFLADRADVMLGYCSSGIPVMREIPGLVNVALPPDLTVGPAYGMIVLSDRPEAMRFALFVLSGKGQAILKQFGFQPIGLP